MLWGTRCSGRHDGAGLLQLDEVRITEDELREIDRIVIIGCGTANYAGLVAKYAIEHWTRIPCEVELAHEFRYRDPILTRNTLVDRDQPVRRDRRHPDGDPLRPSPAGEGARDLQHQRLDDPARVRRGDLHPRRPGDRRRLDQGLPDAAGRLLRARPLPRAGARHEVRRRDRGRRPRAGEDAGARAADPRRRRVGLRARPGARRHPVGALPRSARRLPGCARGCAEAQGAGLHPRRGVRRRRAQARSRSR